MVVNVILQKMSGTATTSILISSPAEYLVRRRRSRDRGGGGGLFLFPNHQAILSLRSSSAISQTQNFLLTYPPYAPHKTHHNHNTTSTSIFTPLFKPPFLMKWQDCKVKMDIEVPTSVAYDCYSDRQAIPCWMPFISSVEILEDKPDLSRWSLKYKAFGRDIEFSWLARNMQPIPNQKIQWRSLEGLPNRGAVRFFPKGPSSCVVEGIETRRKEGRCRDGASAKGHRRASGGGLRRLNSSALSRLKKGNFKLTVSYEVPQLLVPLASVLNPFTESLLLRGLERFAKFAKSYHTNSKR